MFSKTDLKEVYNEIICPVKDKLDAPSLHDAIKRFQIPVYPTPQMGAQEK